MDEEALRLQRRSKYATIKDLSVHPGWLILVEAITEIQDVLIQTMRITKFTDARDIQSIQDELMHYEKLKRLPEQLINLYDDAESSLQKTDIYSQVDAEAEALLKKGPTL